MIQKIPERLKEARKVLNLNQIQIASDLDIQQKSISDIENGKIQNIPNQYIYYFYKKGLSLAWIYEGKEPMFNETIEKVQQEKRQSPVNEIFDEIVKKNEVETNIDITKKPESIDSGSRESLFERIIESKEFNIKSLLAYIKSLENNLEYFKDLLNKS
jgi:transcriptional regulator with XRE-family HTH domain